MKTFGDFLKKKTENVDAFGFSSPKKITPSYFQANTQDKMVTMSNEELLNFILPRIKDIAGPSTFRLVLKSNSLPDNIYDMLIKRRILINDIDGTSYIPKQLIVPIMA